jgi:CubicO group peptidase (beta-lactamase class C family)
VYLELPVEAMGADGPGKSGPGETPDPDEFERLEGAQLLTWQAEPAGFSDLRSVGERAERSYLFSANSGLLRRGTWSGAQLAWDEEELHLGHGFSDFQVAEVQGDGGLMDVAIFVDPYVGKAEAWRVDGPFEQLWVDQSEDWRRRRELVLQPTTNSATGIVAHAPAQLGELRSPVTGASIEVLNRGAADSRSFARLGGATYELVYDRLGSNDGEPSHLRIDRLDEDGRATETVWEQLDDPGWSHLQLLASPGQSDRAGHLWLWRYRSEDGWSALTPIDAELGSEGAEINHFLTARWTDLDIALEGNQVRILGLSEESARPLSNERLGAMVGALRTLLSRRPGYQVVLMQSGRVLFEEAGGWAQVPSSTLPLGAPMTLEVRQNIASISKLITAITFLRLSVEGRIDLDASFLSNSSSSIREAADPSWEGLTTRELLTHNSASPAADCEEAEDGRPNCSALLARERDTWRCERDDEGHACCPHQYRNSNYHLARGVLEHTLGQRSNAAIARVTEEEWMGEIGIRGADCSLNPDVAYYNRSGPTLADWNEVRPDHENGCGESGWHLNATDLARVARAIRYNWLLEGEAARELGGCGRHGWIGWDSPWSSLSGHGKMGLLYGSSWGVQTLIMQLPRNIDIVIVLNSVDDPGIEHFVFNMWSSF